MNLKTLPPVSSQRRAWQMLLSSLLLLVLQINFVHAQEFRGTLTGRVADPQGAAVPGAAITVTNVATNVIVNSVANDGGDFTVPQLQPGIYRVAVEAAGFKKYVRESVILRTDGNTVVDAELTLGDVSEIVTVVGGLATDLNESTIAQTVENKRVSELPLNGRQVYMLAQLTAGTMFTQTQFGASGFSGTRAWDSNGNISIHGSRIGNNEFLIDGAPNAATGGWQFAPVVDAIEEFKVQGSSVDASLGRTGGGVVNMTLKSGTNELHGSAFIFHRGNALDANTTQNNRNGIPREGHRYDNYGGVLTGPIRRDKTFFMGSYEGFSEAIPFPRTASVATELQRRGDFSQTRNSAGQLIQIFDPLTTRPDPTRPGRLIRDPFPGNIIPANRISPIAQRLMSFIPNSNVAGEALTAANNYAASPNLGRYGYNSYLARVDHVFSDRHRIFFSNTANWGNEFRNSNGFPLPATRGNWGQTRDHYAGTFDDVFTFNPTTILNFQIAYDRFIEKLANDYAKIEGDLGIRTPFQTSDPQYPYITIDGYQDFFPNAGRVAANNIYSTKATLSKTFGSHFFKVGGDFRTYRLNRADAGNANARFNFNRDFTRRDPQVGDATSGNGFSSFLLGYPAGTDSFVNNNTARSNQYLYYATFFQDDWKISRRLTLNLGLRWDHQAPPTERFDRQTIGFDPNVINPFTLPDRQFRGGLLFAGVDGNRRGAYKPDYNDFQPRFGLALEVRKGLVLRTHYGRSYLPLTGSGEEGINQTGFSRSTNFQATLQPGIPFNTLERPYPEGLLQPFDSSLGFATNVGSGFSFINPDFETPYADQFTVGLDINLPGNIDIDIAYVNNTTKKLPINGLAINEVPRAERERAIERLGGVANYLNTQLANPFRGLLPGTSFNNETISRSQLLRPFQQFGGITMDRVNEGSARYDAMEVSANKRLSRGLLGVVNYTWMKNFESTGYLNNGYDERPWRALVGFDRTHRLAISALYDLPIGRGKALFGEAGGIAGRLISGWQLNAIGEIQSGTPVPMPNGILLQKSAKLPEGEQTLDRWFDNSTRTSPRPDGTYAWDVNPPNEFRTTNERFSDIRNPTEPQWSFSLFKNTVFKERYNAQFRLEAFNAFNTPIYGGPDTGVASARFGRITRDQQNFPRHIQLGVRFVF